MGGSVAITKLGWRIVGIEQVVEEEEWIPDTKVAWPLFSNPPEKWAYKKRFSTDFTFSSWQNVGHLDDATGKAVEIIPFLLELELLKHESKDILKERGINDMFEKAIYDSHINLPVYTELPDEMKGKATIA